ncbi:hypothetical protein RRG08_024802 [Elysia crispata]|uniref:Uncharacterized protein n=1 Tax=Elysia crispata TaxID=231223 RepID=A0AAE0YJ95_9GAST|nr:hypothetical protein RRG08_024802 [Elysia crispata]
MRPSPWRNRQSQEGSCDGSSYNREWMSEEEKGGVTKRVKNNILHLKNRSHKASSLACPVSHVTNVSKFPRVTDPALVVHARIS